jgi:hypothetical protein
VVEDYPLYNRNSAMRTIAKFAVIVTAFVTLFVAGPSAQACSHHWCQNRGACAANYAPVTVYYPPVYGCAPYVQVANQAAAETLEDRVKKLENTQGMLVKIQAKLDAMDAKLDALDARVKKLEGGK